MIFGDAAMPERFWDKVVPEPNTGCWLWTGALNRKGYANWRGIRSSYVHRDVLMATGAIATDSTDHRCRQKCCVNPEHLEFVTPVVNSYRARRVGHAAPVKPRCPKGHEYTADNSFARAARGTIECRECMRQRWRDWKSGR